MADDVAEGQPDRYPFRAFGRWVEAKRRALGLDQYDMAERMHISVHTFRHLETGYRKPSRDIVRVLGSVTGEKVPDPWVLRARPRRLPAPAASLIGRDADVDAVCDLLQATARLVSLIGPDGVGKSRLAVAVAQRLDERLDHGAWHVDLGTKPPERYADAVLTRLGVAQRARRDPLVRLAEHLADQETLLLLDNVEATKAAAEFVEQMLAQAGGVRLLVTSPAPLGIYGEARYMVAPLPCPEDDPDASLEDLAAAPAFLLFVERFRLGEPRFVLDLESARTIASICRELGGLPLAIEVTAAAAATDDATFAIQKAGSRQPAQQRPQRPDTLLRAVDYTFDLLDRRQQVFFARLGVFAGGFDLAAAAAVSGPDAQEADVAAACQALVEKHLVQADEERRRFDVLTSIRAHMLQRLTRTGNRAAVERRHASHFADLATRSFDGVHGREQVAWLRRLSVEHANLAAAFDWALQHEPSAAVAMAGSLWPYFSRGESLSEGRRWLQAVLAVEGGTPRDRAQALVGAGVLARMQGDAPEATEHLEAGARLARSLGAADLLAFAQLHLGIVAEHAGDYLPADALFKQAMTVAGPDAGFVTALATNCRGMVCLDTSDVGGAQALFSRSLTLFQDRQDGWGLALTSKNLAWTLAVLDKREEAKELYDESLRRYGELGDERGMANARAGLGRLTLDCGDTEAAGELFAEALAAFHALGERRGCGEGLFDLGLLASRQGAWTRAGCLLGAAAAVREAIGAPLWGSERDAHDGVVEALKGELGEEGFHVAWDEGAAMGFEAAIQYALVP